VGLKQNFTFTYTGTKKLKTCVPVEPEAQSAASPTADLKAIGVQFPVGLKHSEAINLSILTDKIVLVPGGSELLSRIATLLLLRSRYPRLQNHQR
jgi:hypothetical protein